MQGKFFFMPSLFSFVLVFSMFLSQAFAAVGSVEHSGRGLHELSEVSSSVQPEPKSEAEPEPEPETEPETEPEPEPELGRAVEQAGRIITLDDEVTKVEQFVLEEGDTLLINEDRMIEASVAIIFRGTVRVELPEDAPQGAWAPRLRLIAGERIVFAGPMVFGDGRDGVDPGVMGGAGASLNMKSPLIAFGIDEIRMGHGGDGGPGIEGGPGGMVSFTGWVLSFHPDGLVMTGGNGGDGGDGPQGTAMHPRGFRGGDGASGGKAVQYNPSGACRAHELMGYMELAIGTEPALDPYLIGPHRLLSHKTLVIAGDGGNGGNGGLAFDPQSWKAGGGLAGTGGNGGYALGVWGLPGTNVTPDDSPPPGVKWSGGKGTSGGDAEGGDGGDGGNTGPGIGSYTVLSAFGGNGGRGGRARGGFGGNAGRVDPPPRYHRFEGHVGQGGSGAGGSGGNAGRGHNGGNGGDGGDSVAGPPGKFPGDE
jgi:hypothetical protein